MITVVGAKHSARVIRIALVFIASSFNNRSGFLYSARILLLHGPARNPLNHTFCSVVSAARAGAVARQLWRAQSHRSVNLFTGSAGVPPARERVSATCCGSH